MLVFFVHIATKGTYQSSTVCLYTYLGHRVDFKHL